MEKDFSKGHFEQLLTEKTGEYKMYPTERVWNSIYHRLHTRRKWRFIGGGTFALMILAAVFVLMQDNPHPPSKVYAVHHPSKTNGPLTGRSTSPVASLTNTSAARAWKSRSLTGNTYLSAGDYLLQSPAWMTAGSARSPFGLLAQTAGTEIPAPAPEKSVPLSVEPPAPGPGAPPGPDNALSHMIANEPLRAGALIADKASAVSSSPLKIIKAPSRYSWLFHFEPSISFRVLKSRSAITTTSNLGFIVVDNNGYDINHLVDQRASVGFEAGADLLYSLTSRLRLKAGLQFNYSRYTAKAISTPPQDVNVGLGGSGTGGIPPRSVSQTSTFSNGLGQPDQAATWIPNQRVELSIPIGAEYRLLRNRSFSWNVAGTFQPSYILNSKSFILSEDYEHYVQYPNLMRPWNINLGLETFLRFDKGPIELQIGPQFRYQLLPSFISSYPISEHLYDIGFKIGIVRNIR
ncbi:outer membrane beta-barrel protein [Dinghuibacter silviterrae]|uniref:Outer membrane protein with beta-barrel domain n=1 Tax=Dinghuibacter silviterrae TaxID=1539049 RepID=A0A4R8DQA5_9BACT|nr:outer membrane beta-barrel protein [Dinghuibacter silviterrae]TDX00099.1 outer membrane protein with beta-barrel domain [Dinghuibacter silviterrae]